METEHMDKHLPNQPILHMDEIKHSNDFRDLVRSDVRSQLTDYDRVVSVRDLKLSSFDKHPSALKALLRLTGVTKTADIGENGPSVASRSSDMNEGIDGFNKYEALFGRDSLWAADIVYERYPKLMKATVYELAKLQGTVNDTTPVRDQPMSQEEPGKIIHEYRDHNDPIARKFTCKKNWKWPFYGSVDSTPLFVNGALRVVADDPAFLKINFIGKDGEQHTIEQSLYAAVSWIEKKMEEHPASFIAYRNFAAERGDGMLHQSWKDSVEAYVHKDGMRANTDDKIASIEVQAMAYDALVGAAALANSRNDTLRTQSLLEKASLLKQNIIKYLWVEDGKYAYFALGADISPHDQSIRPFKVKSSNMGHVLDSTLLDTTVPSEKRMIDNLRQTIMSDKMQDPSGVRTLASDEKAFRPGGYHNGCVWGWDSYINARGLRKYGFIEDSNQILQKIYHVVDELKLFVEHVRGSGSENPDPPPQEIFVYNDQYNELYLFEQPPQEIQAWTVAAMIAIKHSIGRELLPTAA